MTKDKNGGKEQEIRPLSRAFARANYFIDMGDEDREKIPVPALRGSLLYRHGHPARLCEGPIEDFLETMGKINAGVRLDCSDIPSL